VALQLRKLGFTRVRPLAGGFQAWVEAGYPLDSESAVKQAQ
jgi:rhodanese-related sulfurtransferase